MFKTSHKIDVLNFGVWSFGFASCFGDRISYLQILIASRNTLNMD